MSRIFVLGNAGVDVFLGMPRLPARGETLVADTVSRAPGGKGLNQAVTAARAGAEVIFAAPVGEDAEGAWLSDRLAAEPLVFVPITVDQPTDLSVVMVTPEGENCIATAGLAADRLDAESSAAFAGRCEPQDWLLLQGNLSYASTKAAMEATRGSIIFNTAPLRWTTQALIRLCHVVIANVVEAEGITGQLPEAAALTLLDRGARAAIVTLGDAGSLLAMSGRSLHLPAVPARAVDTTGAGDTLTGAIAAAVAAGFSMERALRLGQAAAAHTVTRPGAFAALPSSADLAALWQDA
ncbi:MAG: ribokinase [Proteobacteria bacterium]|nr:ribokinase [Pseudomonadota bacterium]